MRTTGGGRSKITPITGRNAVNYPLVAHAPQTAHVLRDARSAGTKRPATLMSVTKNTHGSEVVPVDAVIVEGAQEQFDEDRP